MEMISSSSNQTVKQIKKLQSDKKERFEKKMFYVEGVNLVRQAIDNGWEIERLFVVIDLIDSDFKRETISLVHESKLCGMSKSIFAGLANKNDLQGISALVKIRESKLSRGSCVVLENVSGPGNLGSAMRAAVAFGLRNVLTVQPCVDFFHPESIRASMGAIFHLNLISSTNTDDAFGQLNEYEMLAATTKGEVNLSEFNQKYEIDHRVAIWFGSEARGLSRSVTDRVKKQLKIQMSGKIDSLNLAESVAIFLYQLIKV